jgi:hypothetical protein
MQPDYTIFDRLPRMVFSQAGIKGGHLSFAVSAVSAPIRLRQGYGATSW